MKIKNCDRCTKISTVTLSSADWQRNEQRHEHREKRLCFIIIVLVAVILASYMNFYFNIHSHLKQNTNILTTYEDNI